MPKPLYREISYCPPELLFNLFKDKDWVIWLDSTDHQEQQADRNRYSYLAIDPVMTLISDQGKATCSGQLIDSDPFLALKEILQSFQLDCIKTLPPFQTGVAGYWAYDLCHYLEPIPYPQQNDMQYPEMAVGVYDLVVAFDHQIEKAWIISSGYPETTETRRIKRAEARLKDLKKQLEDASPLADQTQLTDNEIRSNFKPDDYEKIVSRVIEYIKAGDIFQANLSQRFSTSLPDDYDYFALYRRLRKINAAPFSAYMRFKDYVIASASPERFLKLTKRKVETRPMKGTHIRHQDPNLDKVYANNLLKSEKDRAENIMIVDLMRNDLSKVCKDNSVQVTQLCGLETFKTVHHLVSAIEGELREGMDAVDLLKAAFPGGSITGAPKVRAMQIISELEPHNRGPYCGSIGYISFHGDMDTSIVIRTLVIKKNFLTFHGGGAIIMDSDPHNEYEETRAKTQVFHELLSEKVNSEIK